MGPHRPNLFEGTKLGQHCSNVAEIGPNIARDCLILAEAQLLEKQLHNFGATLDIVNFVRGVIFTVRAEEQLSDNFRGKATGIASKPFWPHVWAAPSSVASTGSANFAQFSAHIYGSNTGATLANFGATESVNISHPHRLLTTLKT